MFSTKSYTRYVAVIAIAMAGLSQPTLAAPNSNSKATAEATTVESGTMSFMRFWHYIWNGPTR